MRVPWTRSNGPRQDWIKRGSPWAPLELHLYRAGEYLHAQHQELNTQGASIDLRWPGNLPTTARAEVHVVCESIVWEVQ